MPNDMPRAMSRPRTRTRREAYTADVGSSVRAPAGRACPSQGDIGSAMRAHRPGGPAHRQATSAVPQARAPAGPAWHADGRPRARMGWADMPCRQATSEAHGRGSMPCGQATSAAPRARMGRGGMACGQATSAHGQGPACHAARRPRQPRARAARRPPRQRLPRMGMTGMARGQATSAPWHPCTVHHGAPGPPCTETPRLHSPCTKTRADGPTTCDAARSQRCASTRPRFHANDPCRSTTSTVPPIVKQLVNYIIRTQSLGPTTLQTSRSVLHRFRNSWTVFLLFTIYFRVLIFFTSPLKIKKNALNIYFRGH